MDLLGIRTQTAKRSGRYDLVDPATFADNGMDFYISEGQKYLNKKSEMPTEFAHLSSSLVTGDYYKDLTYKFKELDSVTVNNGATSWTLTHKTLYELQALYDAGAYTVPMYYAYASYRTLKTALGQTVADFVSLEWPEEDDDKAGYTGIIIIPPADTSYTVMAGGNFLPMELSSDTDTNFWSDEHPSLLIMATIRSIAVLDGDLGTARYWESAIHEDIVQLGFPDRDDVEDDLNDRIL